MLVSPVQRDCGRLTFSLKVFMESIELAVFTYMEQIRSMTEVDVEASVTALED